MVQKDLQVELRRRSGLQGLIMFGVTALGAISFSLGTPIVTPSLAGALLWILLFFVSVVGLGQGFLQEEEAKTLDTLLLAAPVESIFVGKTLANFLLLLATLVVLLPLYFVLFQVPVGNYVFLGCTLLGGSFGLALGTTTVAALLSRGSVRGPLPAVLAFPLLLPLLMGAIQATVAAFHGEPGGLPLLILYPLTLGSAVLLLVEYIWEE
jgi:heme exporter protein B